MFVLKKILGHLLMPLPLGLGLLTLGLLLLLCRRRVRGWLVLLLGWLVLAVAANRAVSLALTASLEKAYPPVPALVVVAPVSTDPATLPEVEPTVPSAPEPEASATGAPALAIPEPLRGVAFVAVLG
ncbi:MAG: hypothetical protein H7067_19385, partial [Burkholderiales bacterium]|nr:hypothetical protein [Opitutaceae bacterium]